MAIFPPVPTILLLHDPAGDPGIWAPVRGVLGNPGRSIAIDTRGMDLDAMLGVASDAVGRLGATPFIVVGHGLGGTVAAALARRAADGGAGHDALLRLVLIGASLGRDEAWSRRVGVLRAPALLVAAADDPDAGPDIQESLVAPHFTASRVRPVASLATPLAPGLAAMIDEAPETSQPPCEPAVDAHYAALIASDRVTRRTREVLLGRAAPLPPSPRVLTPPLLAILRAVIGLLLPTEEAFPDQAGMTVDIARRIDEVLASGDGWRHATLPPDAIAMERGLRTIDDAARATHGRPFLCLDATCRQHVLDAAARGELAGLLDAPAMALWLGELEREAARTWISHPAILGRLGYSGIGSVGGDGPVKRGFARVGADSTEAWEPRPW